MTVATPSSMTRIDARLANLQPGSLRYCVLVALKQFRASWVELGRLLNEMVYGGDYKEYGYDDFEVYCARELGLKKPTVQKLMISYNYMKKYENKRLIDFEEGRDDDAVHMPDFQTVELLDRVRRLGDLPEEKVEEVHARIFNEAGDAEEISARRELRQMLKPSCGADKIESGNKRKAEMAAVLNAARALRRVMAQTKAIPGGLRDRLEQALVELEALD